MGVPSAAGPAATAPRRGADPFHRSRGDGKTPVSIALEQDMPFLAEMLLLHANSVAKKGGGGPNNAGADDGELESATAALGLKLGGGNGGHLVGNRYRLQQELGDAAWRGDALAIFRLIYRKGVDVNGLHTPFSRGAPSPATAPSPLPSPAASHNASFASLGSPSARAIPAAGTAPQVSSANVHVFRCTALHRAAATASGCDGSPRSLLALDVLLRAGADPNRPDSSGASALHYAALVGAEEATFMLLQAGADPLLRNEDGCTPLDIARAEAHAGVLSLLAAHASAVTHLDLSWGVVLSGELRARRGLSAWEHRTNAEFAMDGYQDAGAEAQDGAMARTASRSRSGSGSGGKERSRTNTDPMLAVASIVDDWAGGNDDKAAASVDKPQSSPTAGARSVFAPWRWKWQWRNRSAALSVVHRALFLWQSAPNAAVAIASSGGGAGGGSGASSFQSAGPSSPSASGKKGLPSSKGGLLTTPSKSATGSLSASATTSGAASSGAVTSSAAPSVLPDLNSRVYAPLRIEGPVVRIPLANIAAVEYADDDQPKPKEKKFFVHIHAPAAANASGQADSGNATTGAVKDGGSGANPATSPVEPLELSAATAEDAGLWVAAIRSAVAAVAEEMSREAFLRRAVTNESKHMWHEADLPTRLLSLTNPAVPPPMAASSARVQRLAELPAPQQPSAEGSKHLSTPSRAHASTLFSAISPLDDTAQIVSSPSPADLDRTNAGGPSADDLEVSSSLFVDGSLSGTIDPHDVSGVNSEEDSDEAVTAADEAFGDSDDESHRDVAEASKSLPPSLASLHLPSLREEEEEEDETVSRADTIAPADQTPVTANSVPAESTADETAAMGDPSFVSTAADTAMTGLADDDRADAWSESDPGQSTQYGFHGAEDSDVDKSMVGSETGDMDDDASSVVSSVAGGDEAAASTWQAGSAGAPSKSLFRRKSARVPLPRSVPAAPPPSSIPPTSASSGAAEPSSTLQQLRAAAFSNLGTKPRPSGNTQIFGSLGVVPAPRPLPAPAKAVVETPQAASVPVATASEPASASTAGPVLPSSFGLVSKAPTLGIRASMSFRNGVVLPGASRPIGGPMGSRADSGGSVLSRPHALAPPPPLNSVAGAAATLKSATGANPTA
jgi:hypothetical protein